MYIRVFGTNSAVWNPGVWHWKTSPAHRILRTKIVKEPIEHFERDSRPYHGRQSAILGPQRGHEGFIPHNEGVLGMMAGFECKRIRTPWAVT